MASGDGSPPVRSRGEAPVGVLGDEGPQKLTFLGLKVIFTQNTSTISYFNITHSCQCLKL